MKRSVISNLAVLAGAIFAYQRLSVAGTIICTVFVRGDVFSHRTLYLRYSADECQSYRIPLGNEDAKSGF